MKAGKSSASLSGETLVVRGKKFVVATDLVEQGRLLFYADNPRIYSRTHAEGAAPDQEEIFEALQNMEHVGGLVADIKRNGGLIEPLIVQSSTMVVIEGNSRLAAYRILEKSDGVKWSHVRCNLLPADVDESSISTLLGQYHLKGKTKWQPFEQAGFLYRRHFDQGVSIEDLALEVSFAKADVALLVKTYKFMMEHKKSDATRWSYYYELLKSKKVEKVRDVVSYFDDFIVEAIETGTLGTAAEPRKKLPVICQDKNALNKYMSHKVDFNAAYDQAATTGKADELRKKLEKFRLWLVQPELSDRMREANAKMREQIMFELEQIENTAWRLRDKLTK